VGGPGGAREAELSRVDMDKMKTDVLEFGNGDVVWYSILCMAEQAELEVGGLGGDGWRGVIEPPLLRHASVLSKDPRLLALSDNE
jgi:hypothetical protein